MQTQRTEVYVYRLLPVQCSRRYRYKRSRGYRYNYLSNIMDLQRMVASIIIMAFVATFVICLTANGNEQMSTRSYSKDTQHLMPISATTGTLLSEVLRPYLTTYGPQEKIEVEPIQDVLVETVAIVEQPKSSTEFMNDSVDDPPKPEPESVMEIDQATILSNEIGNATITIDNTTLNRYALPDEYYPGLDFSSFQPYMDYRCITSKSSPAYAISRSDVAYNDEYGMRRYPTTEDQFTIDGQDDYVIALGTFYKEKGTAGSRYLIVTTTGMYTAITGDEKSDAHTDKRHMFSLHSDGSCAGIIEWIVDQKNLERTMKRAGTITAGPIEPLKGEILHIYGID